MNQRKDWLEWVLTTSIPLRRLNVAKLPISLASGCLIDYAGRRFLLSVQHAIDKCSRDWIMELRYDSDKGTEFFRPNGFNYVGEMTRGSSSISDIDFCYTEVPTDLTSTYQHITPYAGITDEKPRHVFISDLTTIPDPDQIFAFSGQKILHMFEDSALVTEMNVYPGLRYVRTEGEYYVFRLPVQHPGHEQFQGCSGAPIVDMNKKLVALVCDGNTDKNTIRGVSLARYKLAFDFVRSGFSAIQ